MGAHLGIFAVLGILAASGALADEIVPISADNEGLARFENNVSQGMRAPAAPKPASVMGTAVSVEARRLRTQARHLSGTDTASGRARGAGMAGGASMPGAGIAGADAAAAGSAAPPVSGTLPNGKAFPGKGNSANAPGHNKNH